VQQALHHGVKPPHKVSLGTSGFERQTEEKLKWRKFNAEIVDLGSLKLKLHEGKLYVPEHKWWIRYRSNVSTEPLPSNDRGIFTEPLPSNNRVGYTDTHRQQRDLISLLNFFQNKESRLNMSNDV
jgi:hypothetical protein